MNRSTERGTAGQGPGLAISSLMIVGLMVLVLVSCGSSAREETAPSPEALVAIAENTLFAVSPLPSLTPPPLPAPTKVGNATAVPEAPAEATTAPPAGSPTAEAPPADLSAAELQPVEHTVRAGESLLGLATDYGVPMAVIQLENDLGEGITVWEGQVLVIPPPAEWEGASPYWLLHLVEAGETLGAIAATYEVGLDAVRAVNGLETDLLSIGQPLIMPLEVPVAAFMAPPTPPPAAGGGSSGESGAAASVTLPPPGPLPADMAAWPAALFQLINQARAAHGLYPLAYNDTLAWAAQLHAEDCAGRGWCSHTGSDGSSSATRILRTGYPAAGTGECWVKVNSVQGAFDFWYYETPPNDAHRRTLLGTYLTEVGIGVVAGDWGYYFVADFGRP